MIEIKFNNDTKVMARDITSAKLRILSVLSMSKGTVRPVEAINILGTTTGGVTVEMEMKVSLFWDEAANGWLVDLRENVIK